ncbi:hypothetical protein FACS18949_13470 [Clostridia bacterium]|nr:hypothetical protein FACS189425_08820 [Clostridia bacterium]GHV35457.1 hypothetical protein FACS18949_13470 [Clostridia bacterium]
MNAGIIVKSEERLEHEAKVLISYNGDPSNPEHRDAVEQISAYSREAMRELNKMEERYR